MLYPVAAIIIGIWLLGILNASPISGLIQLLPILAVTVVLAQLFGLNGSARLKKTFAVFTYNPLEKKEQEYLEYSAEAMKNTSIIRTNDNDDKMIDMQM
jgi:hypothetical protein